MNLRSLLHSPTAAPLGVEGRLPSLDGATEWLNSEPLTMAGLLGSVVLVQFWTYTCINWLRTLPYIRAWAERYADHGVVVIGVHTPEFPFEHDVENVRRAASEMRVDYPIALDNDYAIWQAFGNRYWPALYVVDAEGQIRHHRFGEGEYERTEEVVQQLLGISGGLVSVDPDGVEAAADWETLESPENYLGYERTENFDSTRAAALGLDHWALAGDWTVERGASVLNEAGGAISYRFHARDLNVVMGPAAQGTTVPFRVTLDGQEPGAAHGVDVDERGEGTLAEQRLYQLIRQPGRITDRTLEITFLAPGAEAYAFTFG
ncbi:MAG: thioredoxin family protein [Gaiellaceae bacterium]